MDQAIDLDQLAEDAVDAIADLGTFGELVSVKNQYFTPGSGLPPRIPFGWENWNPEQRQFEFERTGHDLVLKSRQVGLSTIEKLRDLQYVLLYPASHVLIVTHDVETQREFFATLRAWAKELARLGVASAPDDADTVDYLRWSETGSSIKIVPAGATESTAQKRGRSGTIDRLHATEMAFWGAADSTWAALSGAIRNAEVVIESTANGLGNLFHQKVVDLQKGGFPPYEFHFYPWYQHPGREADPSVYNHPPRTRREALWEDRQLKLGITPGQLAWWRMVVLDNGLDFCLQEWPPTPGAAFRSGGDTWIEPEHIERVQASVRKPRAFATIEYRGTKIAPLRVYKPPKKGRSYVIGCDPSEGSGGDAAAIVVLDHRTGETVASWDSNEVKPALLGHVVATIGRTYNTACIGVERNAWRGPKSTKGGGLETIKVLLTEERYPAQRVYHDAKGRAGWYTGSDTRPILFGDMAKAIEAEEVTTPDAATANELASIELGEKRPEVPRKGRRRPGEGGRQDDGLFVAWAIAWQMRSLMRIPGKVIATVVGEELASTRFQT